MRRRTLGGKKNSYVRNLTPLVLFILAVVSTILNDPRAKFSFKIVGVGDIYQYSQNGETLVDHPLANENRNITEADLLKSSCLWYKGSQTYASYASVFGGWDHRTSNRSSPESLNIASFGGTVAPPVLASFKERVNWTSTIIQYASSKGVRGSIPPMIYIPISQNHPAHCMQDTLFTLLPMAYRGELSGSIAVDMDRYGSQLSDDDAHPNHGSYCSQMLDSLGWFDRYWAVPNYTCFNQFWIPAFMHNRFPSGRVRGVNYGNGNGYLHKEDLPSEMIQYLQRELWKGMLYENSNVAADSVEGGGIILVESRIGMSRRIWKEAQVVADKLRVKLGLHESRVRVIDNMASMSVKQQASLYHNAFAFIGPHSGSSANLIFMHPDSTVFEIHCTGDSWAREWLIELGIRHVPVVADSPPCTNHNEQYVSVDPDRLVDKIVATVHKSRAGFLSGAGSGEDSTARPENKSDTKV